MIRTRRKVMAMAMVTVMATVMAMATGLRWMKRKPYGKGYFVRNKINTVKKQLLF